MAPLSRAASSLQRSRCRNGGSVRQGWRRRRGGNAGSPPWGGNAATAATTARLNLTFAEQGNAAARLRGQQRGGHVSPRVRPCWWAGCVERAIGLRGRAGECRMCAPRRGCRRFMRHPAAARLPSSAMGAQCRLAPLQTSLQPTQFGIVTPAFPPAPSSRRRDGSLRRLLLRRPGLPVKHLRIDRRVALVGLQAGRRSNGERLPAPGPGAGPRRHGG